MPGVIGTVKLAVTLAFALPVALMGATFLLDGRLVGAGFIAVAAGMIAVQQYLTTPDDLPEEAAERTVGWFVKEKE